MSRRGFSFFKRSTWSFYIEGRRTPGYSLFDFLHGYFYGRWPYLYIGVGTGEHHLSAPLARIYNFIARFGRSTSPGRASPGKAPAQKFADTYHGKVVPLAAATQLVTIKEDVRLENLEQVIPYDRARDIVLLNPDHIVVLDCPCRSGRANPCLPINVCLVVGEPFASFVAEHHPERSRWITSVEAIAILHAEDKRGHVHHAFFKDAMFGRFYAICNCCACCCGAMQAHRHGTPMLASSGYLCRIDEDLCIGCGDCHDYCQFSALSCVDGITKVDEALCMGCGVCSLKCEQGALFLERFPSRGEPLEIQSLLGSLN
jgi:ferredoxin